MIALTISFGWTSCLISLLIICFTILLKISKNHQLPPGPLCMPLLGNIHQLGRKMHLSFHEMSRKYGEIYRFYLGQQLLIVVSGRRLFDEVLVSQSENYSKRPALLLGNEKYTGGSFVFSDLPVSVHKQQKAQVLIALKKSERLFAMKFARNTLPNHQDNRTSLEKMFSEETISLGRQLLRLGDIYERKYKHTRNGISKYKNLVLKATLRSSVRSICTYVLGKRYKEESEQLSFIASFFEELLLLQNKLNILTSVPFLQKIWCRPLNSFAGLMKSFKGLVKMHINELRKLRMNEQSTTDILPSNSVVECLLQARSNEDFNLDDQILISMVGDIFGAGVDTFSNLLLWIFIYFSAFPTITKQVQNEVDKFVDKNHRLPGYIDRYDLPLTLAYVTEVIRHTSVVPFTIPHTPVRDSILDGYLIPKGALLFVSFMSVNWDPEVFEDFQNFRPERFIKQDHTFDQRLADKVFIYGAGRRVCAGMNIAKIQSFVSVASYLHAFSFKSMNQEESKLPEGTMGIAIIPDSFNVKVCERD